MKKYNKILVAAFMLYIIVHCSLNIDNCKAQWILQTVPQNSGIALSIDFIDSNNGFSCGWYNLHGRSLYTSDGGTHWLPSTVPDSSRSFVTVDIIDSLTGFMAGAYNLFSANISYSPLNKLQRKGSNRLTFDHMNNIGFSSDADYKGLFVKTTDGGRNWYTYGILPSQISYLIGMDFIDENTGVVTTSIQDTSFGMNSPILKTTNGGLTWIEILNIDTVRRLSAIEFIDSDNIIAVGYGGSSDTMHNNSGGMIFKSTDGGSSWNLQFFPHKEFNDVSFTDQFTGFAANNGPVEGSIYKTTDQGLNWDNEFIISGDALLITGIEFYKGSGTGMIYGSLIYNSSLVSFTRRTTDYGASWMQLQLLNTTGWDGLYGGTMISQYNQYISGGNPTGQAAIYHTTNGGFVNVNPNGNSISEKFSLSQNYPNPFNPVTNLEFGISDLGFVSLKVYDILGKEVMTLVNEKLSAGNYKVEFDGSRLPSGVYFYRLTAGEFTDTKRMMLVK